MGDYLIRKSLRQSGVWANSTLFYDGFRICDDCKNLFCAELVEWAPFSEWSGLWVQTIRNAIPLCLSPFTHAVFHVLFLRSQEQVCWIAADDIIARVAGELVRHLDSSCKV